MLVHADSQGKPDVGKAEAERLINQEGVWALIGAYNSSVSMPASLVAERAKKIFMCGASSSAALTQRKEMKYFFRTASTDEIESQEFVDVLQWLNKTQKNANIKTLGIIYENSVFGKNASEQAEKAAAAGGFQVVADVPFNPGATNLDSEVQTLKSKNPDALFGAVLGADYALMVKTMKKMNWLPKVSLNYCSGYQDPVISKQLGPDADYFMGSTAYSPEFASMMPAVAEVEKIFKTKTGGVPFDSDSIQETIAMLVLAQAIEKSQEPRSRGGGQDPVRQHMALPAFPERQGGLRPGRPEQVRPEPRHPAAGRQVQEDLPHGEGGHEAGLPHEAVG